MSIPTLEGEMLTLAHQCQDVNERKGKDWGRPIIRTVQDAMFDVLVPRPKPVPFPPMHLDILRGVIGPWKCVRYEKHDEDLFVILDLQSGGHVVCKVHYPDNPNMGPMWQLIEGR